MRIAALIVLTPVLFVTSAFSSDRTGASNSAELFETSFNEIDPWRTVLDGVMGGRSTGSISQSEPGVLRFSGDLSLENNGGFSQVRRPVDGNQFASADGVELTFRGDGRVYTFDIRTSSVRLMAGGFQREFQTEAGEWNTLQLPFEDFRLYSFGRPVANAPDLDPGRIESIGITLADKNPGDFEISLRSIRAFDADVKASSSDSVSPRQKVADSRLASLVERLDVDRSVAGSLQKSASATDESRRAAAQVFELAINHGAPLFNEGERRACASIYEVAIQAVVSLGEDAIGSDVTDGLQAALDEGRSQHNWLDRAWTFRRAIDRAYASLSH